MLGLTHLRRIATALLLALVLGEAWGWKQTLSAPPGSALSELVVRDLERSVRRFQIPEDARILVVTSSLEPLPIAFPLAPRPVTLRVYYPPEWAELVGTPGFGQLAERLVAARAAFAERGFLLNYDEFDSLMECQDYIVAVGLVGAPLEGLVGSSRVRQLGPPGAEAGNIWFEVLR